MSDNLPIPTKTIYLDHAAATPVRREVIDVMLPYFQTIYGNPSSIHHEGRRALDTLTNVREQVAGVLNVIPSEIIFTSSGTEANNLAIFGIAEAYSFQGKHILISSIEHPSVLSAGEQLAENGFDVEYIPVDTFGRIDVLDTISRVRDDTILISVMLANNEIGTVQPISSLSQKLRESFQEKNRPLLHTDACQATGQLNVSPHDLGVDLMTLNSSKIYGPKGVGMLYLRSGTSLTPLIVGGVQELGKRAGTENLPALVGFAQALSLAIKEREGTSLSFTKLRDGFIKALQKEIPDVHINGHLTERLPNNIHISLPYIEGESLVLLLDTYGICASTGSACSSHSLSPSHVLRAIGQPNEIIHGSLRFSIGNKTTADDLTHTTHSLAVCADRLRKISPLPLHI
ncbi:MAG: cysteine desulfurase [Candidatus Pacebacteria bacterium]|nr:cysteine desulfurase [Candidatus Paceibacterota bacterium]MCF7857554.1 cysteine desulfurase [Candidatus Paceibacterota bacterium]